MGKHDMMNKIVERLENGRKIHPGLPFRKAEENWLLWHENVQTKVNNNNNNNNNNNIDKNGLIKRLEKKYLVSIIIIHHNRPETIPALIQSLNQQTFKNIEIIFVDDNSEELLLDQVN